MERLLGWLQGRSLRAKAQAAWFLGWCYFDYTTLLLLPAQRQVVKTKVLENTSLREPWRTGDRQTEKRCFRESLIAVVTYLKPVTRRGKRIFV